MVYYTCSKGNGKEGKNMVKITKALARKMYNNGEEIMIIPSKIRPNSMLASWIRKPEQEDGDFEKLCNAIFYYNCSPETGMNLVYYAKEV
jgi:hypothetical protein